MRGTSKGAMASNVFRNVASSQMGWLAKVVPTETNGRDFVHSFILVNMAREEGKDGVWTELEVQFRYCYQYNPPLPMTATFSNGPPTTMQTNSFLLK